MERLGLVLNSKDGIFPIFSHNSFFLASAKKYGVTVTSVLKTMTSLCISNILTSCLFLASPPLSWYKSLLEPLLVNFTLNVLVSSSYEIDQVVPLGNIFSIRTEKFIFSLVFLIQSWMNLKTEEIDLYLDTITHLIGILHGNDLLARVNVGTSVVIPRNILILIFQ